MTVAALKENPDYEFWFELEHDEILPFVQEEFASGGWLLRSYLYLNLFFLLFMIGLGILQVQKGMASTGSVIGYSAAGILFTLTLLIPVHEGIHGLAYKLIGAPRVSYGGDLRRFVFYAMADHFVIGRRAFLFIAMAPFALISTLALLALFYDLLNSQWFFLGVILMHTGACAGDFAMLNFFRRHRHEGILTYDDVSHGVSYFYRQRKEGKGD